MDKKYRITPTNLLYLFLVLAIPFICVGGVSVFPAHLRFYATIAAGITCVLLMLSLQKKLIIDLVTIFSLFFCGMIFLSITYSADPSLTLNFAIIYLCCSMLLLADLPQGVFDKILFVTRVVCVIMALSIVLSVFIDDFILKFFSFIVNPNNKTVISQAIHNEIKYSHAYSGLSTERSDAAFIVNVGIAIISAKFFSGKKLTIHDVLQLILFVAALFFTNKRTLFIIPIIAFAVLMLFSRVKNKFLKGVIIAVIAVCLFFVLSAFIPQLSNIYNRFFSSDTDDILNGRGELWAYSLQMFSGKPLIGYGFASYNAFARNAGLLVKGEEWNYYGHNCYYELLGELGIIGTVIFAVAFITPFIYTLILLYKNNGTRHQTYLLMVSAYFQIMCLVYCMSGNVLYCTQQIYLWYMAIAITLCVKRRQGYRGIVHSLKFRFSTPVKGYDTV